MGANELTNNVLLFFSMLPMLRKTCVSACKWLDDGRSASFQKCFLCFPTASKHVGMHFEIGTSAEIVFLISLFISDASMEADVAKGRRDWAFSERDKVLEFLCFIGHPNQLKIDSISAMKLFNFTCSILASFHLIHSQHS